MIPALFSEPHLLSSRSSTPSSLGPSTPFRREDSIPLSISQRMSGKLRLLPAQQIAVTIFKPILIDYTLFVNAFPSPEEVQKLWFQEMPLRMVADPPLPSYFDPSMLREVATPFQEAVSVFVYTVTDSKDTCKHSHPRCRSRSQLCRKSIRFRGQRSRRNCSYREVFARKRQILMPIKTL